MEDQKYTETQYWNGEVPDEVFGDYLKEYGYEYTPSGIVDDITLNSYEALSKEKENIKKP
jgi:hypothetical protein